jgi:RNA polymerase sigma factor (TIGR02999 family)
MSFDSTYAIVRRCNNPLAPDGYNTGSSAQPGLSSNRPASRHDHPTTIHARAHVYLPKGYLAELTVVGKVTALLEASSAGDAKAVQALFELVYSELKQIARKRLAQSRGYSLNTTGLVHEAYLKLSQSELPDLHGRSHFFSLAAKAMRQIVIDHARARVTDKRGGADLQLVNLEEASAVAEGRLSNDEMLRLNSALDILDADEPDLAQLVELRFFVGLSLKEIASLRDVSERTVNRDWRRAKAQLYAQLHPE